MSIDIHIYLWRPVINIGWYLTYSAVGVNATKIKFTKAMVILLATSQSFRKYGNSNKRDVPYTWTKL